MSEINITNVIIHEIKKERQGKPNVILSDFPIENDDIQTREVIEKLCDILKYKSLERAIFKDGANFVNHTQTFTNFSFKESTKNLVNKLKDELVNATNAKGGFLVFFEHKTRSNSFFSTFLVRNTRGFVFQESESVYKPTPTEYIDLDHVAMGVRVNITNYLSQSTDRYITLVRGNTDISEYFKNWVGIDNQESEKTDCQNLLSIASKIPLPEGMERDEFKQKIGNYAKNAPNNRISLIGLSEYLYQDPDTIQGYAEKKGIDIDSEFAVKGKYLNSFFKVSVQADGIQFSAKREDFDSGKVKVDANNNQIIITSEKLLQEITNQL